MPGILLIISLLFGKLAYYPATDARIRYVGRVDFSDRGSPRFWAAGVYIRLSGNLSRIRAATCQ